MKTTIVFRGLMVLNKQADCMEIGFVDALDSQGGGHPHTDDPVNHSDGQIHPSDHTAVHVPRILTMTDGVLASIFDLRNRAELGKVRNWELVVTKPLQPGITTIEEGGAFVRTSHTVRRDFRWITDLEADDLHGRPLSSELNTRQLLMVLYVRHGEFYTKLQSPELRRRRVKTEQTVPYGRTAAVVGCDITFDEGGGVKLMAGGSTGVTAFEFGSDEGTVYEISNAPPDVPVNGPTPIDAPGHFHMYYDKLFNDLPNDQFDLIKDDMAPAPDPALCGATLVSRRDDPL